MKTSANGLAFIGRWEGTVLHVYKDIRGIPTIGVGHVLRPGESYPNGITQAQAMQLLANDVAIAEHAINADVKVPITQNQFDALASFTFNCGTGALAQSSTLRLLNAGDVTGAADALLLWDHAGTTVDQGLLHRRQSERALFLTPDPVVSSPPPPTPSTPSLAVDTPGDDNTDPVVATWGGVTGSFFL